MRTYTRACTCACMHACECACGCMRVRVLPSIGPSVRRSVGPSVRPTVRPSVRPSVRLCVRASLSLGVSCVCVCVCVCVCMKIRVSRSHPVESFHEPRHSAQSVVDVDRPYNDVHHSKSLAWIARTTHAVAQPLHREVSIGFRLHPLSHLHEPRAGIRQLPIRS